MEDKPVRRSTLLRPQKLIFVYRRLGVLLVIIIAIYGCAIQPYWKGPESSISFNWNLSAPTNVERPDNYTPLTKASADLGPAELRDGKYIGLAVSGGGSRAAVFASAVMYELEQLSILGQVDLISCASAGCIPSAYYALNRKTGFVFTPSSVLEEFSQNISSHTLRRILWPNPLNLAKMLSGAANRTDMLAQVLDDLYFHEATFADLERSDGPKLLIHATTKTSMVKFVFSDHVSPATTNFHIIKSDLRSYPLSYAVTAGAAYPLWFRPMTMEDFRDGGYLRLFDGGAYDNLSISSQREVIDRILINRAAVDATKYRFSPNPIPWQENHQKDLIHACLLIFIDSAPSVGAEPSTLWNEGNRRSLNFPLDIFPETDTVENTVDLLFYQRRSEILHQLDLIPPNTSLARTSFKTLRSPRFSFTRQTVYFDESEPVRSLDCIVWNIALPNLYSTLPSILDQVYKSEDQMDDELDNALSKPGLDQLHFLPSLFAKWPFFAISTKFSIDAQDTKLLFLSAKCLVYELDSLDKICSLLKCSPRAQNPKTCKEIRTVAGPEYSGQTNDPLSVN